MTEHPIDTAELVRFASENHHSPEDLDDGDLSDRLWQFSGYEKAEIDLEDIDLDEFAFDQDLVDEYAGRIQAGEIPPPIVYDPVNRSIIDGIHRARAWAAVGTTRIEVLSGIRNTYDPIPAFD